MILLSSSAPFRGTLALSPDGGFAILREELIQPLPASHDGGYRRLVFLRAVVATRGRPLARP